MKYIYNAVISPLEGEAYYEARVPDISGCVTGGADISEAIDMITDAAAGCLVVAEDNSLPISAPTPQSALSVPDGGIVTVIKIDTIAYRSATDTRSVRKNVSLPAWLANMADKRGVNCSQVLQESLKALFS